MVEEVDARAGGNQGLALYNHFSIFLFFLSSFFLFLSFFFFLLLLLLFLLLLLHVRYIPSSSFSFHRNAHVCHVRGEEGDGLYFRSLAQGIRV